MGDILLKNYHIFLALIAISIITSCSLLPTMTTSSGSAKQLGFVKTTVDLISEVYTDKSVTDHAVSVVLGKDCKMSRVTKREKICHENKANVFDNKTESKMSMVLNLRENDLTNFNEKFVEDRKKFTNIKKNNVEILKNHNGKDGKGKVGKEKNKMSVVIWNTDSTLAHSVINTSRAFEVNSDNSTLANNLSSVYIPLEKSSNEI